MSSLLDQELEPTENVFVAHCDSPGNLHYVLKALEFKEKPKLFCSVTVSQTGMMFTVESHKNFQGSAYLGRSMFSEWDLRVDRIEFRIGLVDFMESVNCMHAKTATVKISMRDEKTDSKDRRVYITVTDRKAKADISLPVYYPTSDFDFNFTGADVRAKIILLAKTIKKVFQDIDPKENPRVEFAFQPEVCCITTNMETLKNITRFPKHSPEVIDIDCECEGLPEGEPLYFDYKSIFIKRLKYATMNSAKVSLTINDNGVLSAQFHFAKVAMSSGMVEFYMNPMEPDVQM